LSTDTVIDNLPISSYSVIYRASQNFELKNLVPPEHWEKHKYLKSITSIK